MERVSPTLNYHEKTGPNTIPSQILEHFKKTLSEPLNKLIYLFVTTDVFSKIAKIAKIERLNKKENN